MKRKFAERLKELRGSMSQEEFASKIGEKQTSYSSWERGAREPVISVLENISNRLGVSTDWLLGLTDQRSPFIEVPRENKVSKTPEIREKFPSFGSPVCRSVRQFNRTLNPQEITEVLCNLTNRITQLETQLAALQSTSIATCG